MNDGGQDGQPGLRVIRGQASREELAVVTAVIAAVLATRQRHAQAAQAAQAAPAHRLSTRPGWPDRAALLHAPPMPGPGAWRRAVRPR